MKIEIWEDDDGVTSIPAGSFHHYEDYFAGTPKLLRTIEGDDWNECLTKHHELMGWEHINL